MIELAEMVPYAAAAELASLLLFARANLAWRSKGMRRYPLAMLWIRAVVAVSILLCGGFLMDFGLPSVAKGFAQALPALLLGMYGGIGLIVFAISLNRMPAQLVFFGGSIHLIFGTVIGGLALDEEISRLTIGIIVILFIGQLFVIWQDRKTWASISPWRRILPFLVGFIWGTYYPVYGYLQKDMGLWDTLVITEFGVFSIISLAFLSQIKSQVAGLRSLGHFKVMSLQAVLSILAQGFTALCISWGGVVLHSILTNFSSLINVTAFRYRFQEKFDFRYLYFFIVYGVLMGLLTFFS